jgi:hypothetical protein
MRLAFQAATQHRAAVAKVPKRFSASNSYTMVKAAERTLWVKGDPGKKVLGDCPFCHRALLMLELKVPRPLENVL